jgi:hypothetical protein
MTKEQKTFYERLVLARQEINNPKRTGLNTYQKNKYVTLQSLYDTVLPPLLEQGLIVINPVEYIDGEPYLVTKIVDSLSDQFLETKCKMNANLSNQEQGSERTYLSRYNLGCLLSIRTDYDDDGVSTREKKLDETNPQKLKLIESLLEKLPTERQESFFKYAKAKDLKDIKVEKYDEFTNFLEKAIKKYMTETNNG